MDCLSLSAFCSVHLGHNKNLWLIRALYIEGPYNLFFPSPSHNSSCSRQKKIMQLCSCHSQSSKGYDSFSAQTCFLSATEHSKKHKKPARAFPYIDTYDHTSPMWSSSPHPLQPSSWDMAATWVPVSKVTEQSNSLAPWFQGTFGFRSVTTEVPQRLPISHVLSFKDFRVTAETGDRLSAHLSDTHARVFSRQKKPSTWCPGTCNILTTI